jgi:hypothetical protein
MRNINSFSELLELARSRDFYTRQHLIHCLSMLKNQDYLVLSKFEELLTLAKANDSVAAQLAKVAYVRQMVQSFSDLQTLAMHAPETAVALLNYADVRTCITSFNELLELLQKIELLRITLPPHADMRQLVQTPAHLKRLSRLRISAHSQDNLAQLFMSYADVRSCFKSFRQLLKFINANPQMAQLFIKDEHTLALLTNARQLNSLLKEVANINVRWSRNAAVEFSRCTKTVQLFKKQAELMEFLGFLPDKTSIAQFVNKHPKLSKLLQTTQSSLFDMDFFQNKSLHIAKPSVPYSLLQYA